MTKELQTRVEKVIVKNGFIRTHGLGYYSSIIPGGVWSRYVKDEVEVVVGLNEKGHPPTLIYPRHMKAYEKGDKIIGRLPNDSEMNEMIINMTDDEIMDYICKPKQR
jgi:hypothetical protein